jgi:hypothetical protein
MLKHETRARRVYHLWLVSDAAEFVTADLPGFKQYNKLADWLIDEASKDQLAECARLLALNVAHYQRKFGQVSTVLLRNCSQVIGELSSNIFPMHSSTQETQEKSRLMNFIRALLLVLAVLATTGCDGEAKRQAELLQTENMALRKELEEMKRERDELKFGAARLLAQIESEASKSEWEAVKKLSEDLIARHPSSTEANRAKQILANATSALARAAAEAKNVEMMRLEAERKQKQAEERRLAVALSKMSKKVDTIEHITWYRDRSSPKYTNHNAFFLYIGEQEFGPFLRLRLQYTADDWLFIQSFMVVADGRRFDYDPVDFKRDHDSEIWEWYDENATGRDLEMVKAVIASHNAVVRYIGQYYKRDRTITAAEKAALRNVLDAYKVLGGI